MELTNKQLKDIVSFCGYNGETQRIISAFRYVDSRRAHTNPLATMIGLWKIIAGPDRKEEGVKKMQDNLRELEKWAQERTEMSLYVAFLRFVDLDVFPPFSKLIGTIMLLKYMFDQKGKLPRKLSFGFYEVLSPRTLDLKLNNWGIGFAERLADKAAQEEKN